MVVGLQQQSSQDLEKWAKEWLRCKFDPFHFLTEYCYLQDRAQTKTVKFEAWPHLIWLFNLLLTEWMAARQERRGHFLVIGKARQIGITWLVSLFKLWLAKFHENAKCLCISQGEDEAFDFVSKAKFADDNLPEFLKSKREPDSMGFIGFPDSHSEIRALPSTIKAGHGTDASMVTYDEADFHEYFETSFAAVKPTIDAGGLLVEMSKRDKLKSIEKSLFTQHYLRAKSAEGNFKAIFLPALVVPRRDMKWIEYASADLADWQKKQEYPLTEDDFLYTPKALKYLDQDMLDLMLSDCINPLEHELSKKYKTVKIFQLPVVGEQYCLFNDPSDGKGDPHGIVVIKGRTKEQVAESHGKIPADQCALVHDELTRFYINALNSWEVTGGAGSIISEKLKELNTPNRAPYIKPDGTLDHNKLGQWPSEVWKKKAIRNLEEAVRLRLITPRSEASVREFMLLQQPEGDEPQVPRGSHDDLIDAWKGVLELSKMMRFGTFKITSHQYND